MKSDIIQEVEAILGYCFVDKGLLIRALTRKAYALEQRQKGVFCNDQGVFCTLGDSVLQLILVKHFMHCGFRTAAEISSRKQKLENRNNLGSLPIAQMIAPFIRLGNGEKKQQVEKQVSVVGETLEAVIAAVFQDGGLEIITKLVSKWFSL